MSWSRGSSVTMLSRIRASTKASSVATPKSSEPMIRAVLSRAIARPYITISRALHPCGSKLVQDETGVDGDASATQELRATSSIASAMPFAGTAPFPATRRIVGAMASRNVWIMSSRLPIQSAIITTGIMIVMNGYTRVSSCMSVVARRIASELLPPVHRVVGGVEVLHDLLHLGDREVRFLLEHGERLAERDPFVHHLHLVEVVVSMGRAVPEDVEAADDVVDQVEQRNLFLTQHGHEPFHERRRVEVRVQHGAEDHVVEVLRLQVRVVPLVDEVVQDADHAFSEDLRSHRTVQILRRHVRAVLLRHHRRPRRETQRLQVIPHLTLVLPEGAGRDVRRPQGYALRSREVPELLQAHVDVRDVVPQRGLVEPEVVA